MSERPWIAEWRSNLHGWNEREGSRFATREAAETRADEMMGEGVWDVRVVYSPVIQAAKGASE